MNMYLKVKLFKNKINNNNNNIEIWKTQITALSDNYIYYINIQK